MVDSARKELECPICMEVMMPPARIWQCKVGFFVVVFELKYFQDGICKNLAVHCYFDPTCLKCKLWRRRWIGSCCWPRWLTRHLWDVFRFTIWYWVRSSVCHIFTSSDSTELKTTSHPDGAVQLSSWTDFFVFYMMMQSHMLDNPEVMGREKKDTWYPFLGCVNAIVIVDMPAWFWSVLPHAWLLSSIFNIAT